ncbi:MAG: hypothetical protein ACFE68_09450 [Candidatus Hodarchaeota archaeon]
MAWEEYFNKAFVCLENAKKYEGKRDHKAAFSVGFSSIEALIKGFILKEIGRPSHASLTSIKRGKNVRRTEKKPLRRRY